ncbi:hypothetical protein [Xanthomonas albilineans]|uniref:hypothetical protein n=1 Tax=Xanthomonas albilineans TaxID=29447 RepID=UPI0005F33BBE|nr:hypothetical protein [Xanthomonas albilineans]
MSENRYQQGDPDASMLEEMFQLALNGELNDGRFKQLNDEIYERMRCTYENAAIGSAKAQLRGQQIG